MKYGNINFEIYISMSFRVNMVVNIAGLVVLAVFYAAIFVVGVLAARRKGRQLNTSSMERSIVAGRDINVYVGIFTMTGKWIMLYRC